MLSLNAIQKDLMWGKKFQQKKIGGFFQGIKPVIQLTYNQKFHSVKRGNRFLPSRVLSGKPGSSLTREFRSVPSIAS